MKNWDLTSGIAKLGLAMESLIAINIEVEQSWNDEAHAKFQELYIEPLEPKVRNVLDTVRRLSEVLATAERQCGMNPY